MFGLSEEVVDKINNVFLCFDKVEKVIIYGSRAKDNYRKGSDIDLTLIGDNLDLKTLFAIDDKIENLNLPYMFDLSIYSKIDNDNLIDHISRIGKIFYIKQNVSE